MSRSRPWCLIVEPKPKAKPRAVPPLMLNHGKLQGVPELTQKRCFARELSNGSRIIALPGSEEDESEVMPAPKHSHPR